MLVCFKHSCIQGETAAALHALQLQELRFADQQQPALLHAWQRFKLCSEGKDLPTSMFKDTIVHKVIFDWSSNASLGVSLKSYFFVVTLDLVHEAG